MQASKILIRQSSEKWSRSLAYRTRERLSQVSEISIDKKCMQVCEYGCGENAQFGRVTSCHLTGGWVSRLSASAAVRHGGFLRERYGRWGRRGRRRGWGWGRGRSALQRSGGGVRGFVALFVSRGGSAFSRRRRGRASVDRPSRSHGRRLRSQIHRRTSGALSLPAAGHNQRYQRPPKTTKDHRLLSNGIAMSVCSRITALICAIQCAHYYSNFSLKNAALSEKKVSMYRSMYFASGEVWMWILHKRMLGLSRKR